MTERQINSILYSFRLLAADLTADQMPEWMEQEGKALQFYGACHRAKGADERLLAAYNAFGALLGYDGAVNEIASILGVHSSRVSAALDAARGDCDAKMSERLSAQQVDAVCAALRAALLPQ